MGSKEKNTPGPFSEKDTKGCFPVYKEKGESNSIL